MHRHQTFSLNLRANPNPNLNKEQVEMVFAKLHAVVVASPLPRQSVVYGL